MAIRGIRMHGKNWTRAYGRRSSKNLHGKQGKRGKEQLFSEETYKLN